MNNDEGQDIDRQGKSKRLPDNDVAEENKRLREELAKAKEKQAKAEEEAAEEKKRRLESEEEKAELEKLYQQSEEEKAKLEKLSDGTYYATIDQVWGIEAKFYKDFKYFAALIREKAPSFTGRDQGITPSSTGRDKVKVYSPTKTFALDAALVAADDGTTSRSSMSRNKRDNIWPTDIFGNAADAAPIAHLIPASSKDASVYFDVVIWALRLGLPFDEDLGRLEHSVNQMDWNTLQKAIHGSKSQSANSRREAHTGIKHSVCNKIRLAGQFEYFDQAPCVFVIPVMNLEEVKKWNGEGYDALVMCGSKDNLDADVVCQNINMTKDGAVAEDESQIEKARQLLEAVVLGMANSLLEWFESRLSRVNDASLIASFHELRNPFLVPTGDKKVKVPEARPRSATTESVEGLKVRVVTFFSHESGMLLRTHCFWQSRQPSIGRGYTTNRCELQERSRKKKMNWIHWPKRSFSIGATMYSEETLRRIWHKTSISRMAIKETLLSTRKHEAFFGLSLSRII